MLFLIGGIALSALVVFTIVLAIAFRTVVEPNEVHIVQSSRGTKVYGKYGAEGEDDLEVAGNSYYAWPAWIPFIGVQNKVLPLSVFNRKLENYEAYDIGRVPFMVDIVAFFRISHPAVAAKRISSTEELYHQLDEILRGAVRSILAKHDIEEIMGERSTFGKLFTDETEDQLKAWGVSNVKNIELMDIRDGKDSKTVSNIMAKKESLIEMQSRTEVARNVKDAQVAEIDAARDADIRRQEAEQQVGQRTAEKEKAVGIAQQKAEQEVKAEQRITAEKDMAVKQVQQVRQAEIERDAKVVEADQQKQTDIIKAEGLKQKTVIEAQGNLEQQKLDAQGIEKVGAANAEAKRLLEMSTVSPQIELAHEIGENEGYQTYLVKIRGVEKDQVVGVEQAKALQAAGIKVIANTGDVVGGVNKVMDLFSSKGGTATGAALEGLAQTDLGQALLQKLGVQSEEPTDAPEASELDDAARNASTFVDTDEEGARQ